MIACMRNVRFSVYLFVYSEVKSKQTIFSVTSFIKANCLKTKKQYTDKMWTHTNSLDTHTHTHAHAHAHTHTKTNNLPLQFC